MGQRTEVARGDTRSLRAVQGLGRAVVADDQAWCRSELATFGSVEDRLQRAAEVRSEDCNVHGRCWSLPHPGSAAPFASARAPVSKDWPLSQPATNAGFEPSLAISSAATNSAAPAG